MMKNPTKMQIDLIDRIEKFQYRKILSAGMDPQTFSGQRDIIKIDLETKRELEKMIIVLRHSGNFEQSEAIERHIAHSEAASVLVSEPDSLPLPRSGVRFAARYQRHDDMLVLDDLLGTTIDALSRLDGRDAYRRLLKTFPIITIATVPLGRCNAAIIPAADRASYGIILDDEIVRVATQIGHFLARIVKPTQSGFQFDADYAEEQLSQSSVPMNFYLSIVGSFYASGWSANAVPPPPRSQFDIDVMSTFSQLAVIWIMAHELGHAHLNHLTSSVEMLGMFEEISSDNFVEIEYILSAEREADAFATAVVQKICAFWGTNASLATIAAGMFMQIYCSIYDAIYYRCGASLSADAKNMVIRSAFRHPSPQERLTVLIDSDGTSRDWMSLVTRRLDAAIKKFSSSKVFHPRWGSLVSDFRNAAL